MTASTTRRMASLTVAILLGVLEAPGAVAEEPAGIRAFTGWSSSASRPGRLTMRADLDPGVITA